MSQEYFILQKKKYQIPHNYKNSGRIFNLFTKEALTKALIWIVPVTIIIFKFAPLRIDNKFFIEILIGAPPAAAFCFGLDLMLLDILKFNRNRKVYYDLGEEVSKDDKAYQGAYEQAKKQEYKPRRNEEY